MRCQELVELVTDYLEGALSEEDQGHFERHLAECANCARYLDQMRVTIATVGQISIDSVPPEVRRAALDAFRDWSPGR